MGGIEITFLLLTSGVASGGIKGGQSAPLDNEKNAKNREKEEGENQEKSGKMGIGKKEEKSEGSFALPLLRDRVGYAAAAHCGISIPVGGTQLFSGRGVRSGFPKCGAYRTYRPTN